MENKWFDDFEEIAYSAFELSVIIEFIKVLFIGIDE